MNFLDKRILVILGITLVCFVFYYILLVIGMYEEGFMTPEGLPSEEECKAANCSWNGEECNLPNGLRWSNTKNICTSGIYFGGITTHKDCINANCLWDGTACSTPDGMIFSTKNKKCEIGSNIPGQ